MNIQVENAKKLQLFRNIQSRRKYQYGLILRRDQPVKKRKKEKKNQNKRYENTEEERRTHGMGTTKYEKI